jgi:hypothetical protein
MAIIYGASGIALNHHIARHWNASLVEKTESVPGISPVSPEAVTNEDVTHILEGTGEMDNYKQYYFPNDLSMMIYLDKGHILVNLESGETTLVKIRNRRVFREMNFLHYNKPKQLWTYFADLFGLSMVFLAITGLFMVRGKKGIRGQGAVLMCNVIFIPLTFLLIYLWA